MSRLFIWTRSIEVIKHHPLLGVGWGLTSFWTAIRDLKHQGIFTDDEAYYLVGAQHPHNSFLFISVFLGNIALIVFLIMLINIYKSNVVFFKECRNEELRIVNLGFMCGIIGFLISTAFGFQLFEKATGVSFWIILGLNLSLLKHVRKEQQQITK